MIQGKLPVISVGLDVSSILSVDIGCDFNVE